MSALRVSFPLVLIKAALTRLPSRARGFAALTRSRRGLIHLDDHLLQDIGLTRSQALAEAERPVWDAPSHWKT